MVIIAIQQDIPGVDPLTDQEKECFRNQSQGGDRLPVFQATCEGVDFNAVENNNDVSLQAWSLISRQGI